MPGRRFRGICVEGNVNWMCTQLFGLADLIPSGYGTCFVRISCSLEFMILVKSLSKSLWEAVLRENVGAEMLIGCVHNFLVLRICYKVDMGHVSQGFHAFSNYSFGQTLVFSELLFFRVFRNVTTKMTAWAMGSFHDFGKKWSRQWYFAFRSRFL